MSLVVNVVCGIDDSYCQHCAVMLTSLMNHSECYFNIYVLSLGLSATHRSLLSELVAEHSASITFIDVDYSLVNGLPIKKSDYLSIATYLRLFIPQLLPISIDKVLYLDSDIVVNCDIKELYITDINKYSLAAMEDAPNTNPIRLQYDVEDLYFNAGVLLLNVAYLRTTNFTERALAYLGSNADKIVFHDQDVLNAILHGTTLFLPIKWNMLDCFYNKRPNINPNYKVELLQSDQRCVLHFSGSLKPWHYGCSHPLKKEYFKYLSLVKWGDASISYFYCLKTIKFPLNLMVFCGFSLEFSLYAFGKCYKILKKMHLK